MHISDLPSDILHLVLQKSSKDFIGDYPLLKYWSILLPLLAVCQKWRQIAVPYVYAWAIVYSHEDMSDDEYDSNLQLIINNQASQHVKQLNIIHYKQGNYHLVFKRIIDLMATAAPGWINVKKLGVLISGSGAMPEGDVNALVGQLAGIIPNIYDLDVYGLRIITTSKIPSTLANVYMPQLKYLNATIPLELTVPEFPKTLTKLTLLYSIGKQLFIPKVYAESLHYLRIDDLPCNYNWSDFVCQEDDNAIVFTNLKKLQIDYVDDMEYNQMQTSACKIYFPKIRHLDISDATEDCYILRKGIFPSALNVLNVEGTEDALAHLAKLNITQANALKIEQNRFIRDTVKASQFIHSINTITNTIKARNECTLRMYNSSDLVNAVNLNWRIITHITLIKSVNASLVLKTLSQLPGLKFFCAFLENIDVTADDVGVPLPTDTQLVVPIHTKIKQMDLHLQNASQLNIAIDFAKYLLLHLPSLSEFGIDDMAQENLQNIVTAYKAKYPHLENITFE